MVVKKRVARAGIGRSRTDPKEVLARLERLGSRRFAAGMTRFGIVTELRVLGVQSGPLKTLAKALGKDHALAAALWKTRCFEARMLAALVDDPQRVTPAQMEAWAAAFDNWAICDAACFHLFDKSPHAWRMARRWSSSRHEFVKRSSFALIASLALHDKQAEDARFLKFLPLVEKGARDERNFVKKGVSWALRGIGKRSPALHAAGVELATRLARSDEAAPRWVGKDALRDLTRPVVRARWARLRSG
jgi:3-methyladenine DNA glycosylase AlkD